MEEKKLKLNIGINLKEEKPNPEFKIRDNFDENSHLELTVSKDKIYANYELKF